MSYMGLEKSLLEASDEIVPSVKSASAGFCNRKHQHEYQAPWHLHLTSPYLVRGSLGHADKRGPLKLYIGPLTK